ncbi:MAG: hypothetical protein AAFX10_11425 [Pseudomonadota bacterium]
MSRSFIASPSAETGIGITAIVGERVERDGLVFVDLVPGNVSSARCPP